ncbi:UNVERIFIED_CONTAM: hypothetical protein K2H54_060669 [Gekko kuhli]
MFADSGPNTGESVQVPVPTPGSGLGPGDLAPAPRPPEIVPKGLLDAKFDGTPEKFAFFVVQVEKFLQAWGHLFLTEARRVGYIAAQLHGGAADRYVNLHRVRGPKLQEVAAFMWALRAKYEGPLESERAQNYRRTLKQDKLTVQEYIEESERYSAKGLWEDPGRKKQDSPLKKGMAKPKAQQALQFEVLEESSSSTSRE